MEARSFPATSVIKLQIFIFMVLEHLEQLEKNN